VVLGRLVSLGPGDVEAAWVYAPAFQVEAVKHHVDRRGGGDLFWSFAEPLKPRHELVIEDGHLTIQDQGHGRQGSDRSYQVREAPAVVFPCSADEADSSAILVGDHPPAVVLLFVDPALAVERPGDFIRLHGGDMREAHPPCLPVTTRRSSRLDRVRHVRATTTRDPGPGTLTAAFQIAAVSMLQDGWLRGRPEADPPWGGETSTLRMISAR